MKRMHAVGDRTWNGPPQRQQRRSGLAGVPENDRRSESPVDGLSPNRRTWIATGPVSTGDLLGRYARSRVPGLQYVAVDGERTLFEYAGGWADVRDRRPMTLDTAMMAYSMTKICTAVAILQLVERQALGLDDGIDRYLPQNPYTGHSISIRHLLNHTSGIPNPLPLRWVHLQEEDAAFNEDAALARVLRENPKLEFRPGRRFAYSNIGYWLLGRIVEGITGGSYRDYVRANILRPLGLPAEDMEFVVSDPERQANGYVAKYSLTNLLKGFLIDGRFWDAYDGNWLRLNPLYVDGAAFGGLIGTARGFGRFLQDLLRPASVLLSPAAQRIMETRQTQDTGKPIPTTLGWHVGKSSNAFYLFKQGGGGGFQSEMRLYRARGIATVLMANATDFRAGRLLNRVDREWR
ncbi:MAG TPA: serine hydrolase domain-containing protein [Woeseiaceae bacterium]|nr:serine hydrolase domain-containing protein [Woeseiaceae bacterium]